MSPFSAVARKNVGRATAPRGTMILRPAGLMASVPPRESMRAVTVTLRTSRLVRRIDVASTGGAALGATGAAPSAAHALAAEAASARDARRANILLSMGGWSPQSEAIS